MSPRSNNRFPHAHDCDRCGCGHGQTDWPLREKPLGYLAVVLLGLAVAAACLLVLLR